MVAKLFRITRPRLFNGWSRRKDLGILLVVVGSCTMGSPPALAQRSAPDISKALENPDLPKAIDQELAARNPSGSFLFAAGNRILFQKSYGVLDGSNRPMPPDVVFPIGSLTKQFTAAAILQLAQQRRLKLTDTLDRFFPEVPSDKRGITIHQLLAHTSGLPRNVGDVYDHLTTDEFRQKLFATPLEAAPNSKHSYSNSGYMLLGQIVERVSKMPLASYFDQRLLRPARMMNTGYPGPRFANALIPEGFDRPKFGETYSGTPMTKAGEQDPRYRAGNGGLLSTVRDLFRWQTALRSGRILRPEWERLMRTPHAAITPDNKYRYGYAWVIQDSRSGPMFWHNGVWHSYYSEIRIFPELGVVGVGFTNRQQDETFDQAFAAGLKRVLEEVRTTAVRTEPTSISEKLRAPTELRSQ